MPTAFVFRRGVPPPRFEFLEGLHDRGRRRVLRRGAGGVGGENVDADSEPSVCAGQRVDGRVGARDERAIVAVPVATSPLVAVAGRASRPATSAPGQPLPDAGGTGDRRQADVPRPRLLRDPDHPDATVERWVRVGAELVDLSLCEVNHPRHGRLCGDARAPVYAGPHQMEVVLGRHVANDEPVRAGLYRRDPATGRARQCDLRSRANPRKQRSRLRRGWLRRRSLAEESVEDICGCPLDARVSDAPFVEAPAPAYGSRPKNPGAAWRLVDRRVRPGRSAGGVRKW